LKKLAVIPVQILILSVYLMAQSASDINYKNDGQDLIKRTGIKTKSVWEFRYVEGNENAFTDSGYKSHSFFYDEFGRLTDYTRYHVFAALTVREAYTYDKLGRIARNSRYNSNGDVIEIIDYKYNSKGLLKKEIHSAYYNSVRVGVYFTITANINETGLFSMLQDELQIDPKLESYMITINITDSEELNQYVVIGDEAEPSSMRFSWSQLSAETQKGLLGYEGPNRNEHSYTNKFISNVIYKCDISGNLKERTVFNTSNDIIEREAYKYNSVNKKINYYKYNDNGKLSSMETYSYNNGGRLSESIGLDAMGKTVGKIIYKYDDNGALAEKLWVKASGEVNSRTKYLYNENNRLKEEIKYRGENEIENSLAYKYDEGGNLNGIIRYDVSGKKEKLWKYVIEKY